MTSLTNKQHLEETSTAWWCVFEAGAGGQLAGDTGSVGCASGAEPPPIRLGRCCTVKGSETALISIDYFPEWGNQPRVSRLHAQLQAVEENGEKTNRPTSAVISRLHWGTARAFRNGGVENEPSFSERASTSVLLSDVEKQPIFRPVGLPG